MDGAPHNLHVPDVLAQNAPPGVEVQGVRSRESGAPHGRTAFVEELTVRDEIMEDSGMGRGPARLEEQEKNVKKKHLICQARWTDCMMCVDKYLPQKTRKNHTSHGS